MKYRIGIWLVDSEDNKINNTETNKSVRLAPRAMEVLTYFLDHQDKVISLEELIAKVWSGRVVGDHAVYRVINKIRKHLDPSNKDAYLETIPRKGYKLIVPVERLLDNNFEKQTESVTETLSSVSEETLTGKDSAATKEFQKNSSSTAIKYVSLLLITFFSVFVLWKKFLAPNTQYKNIIPFNSFQAFVTFSGYKDFPSVSKNGRYVVFSYKENEGDSFNLYLKDEKTNNVIQITDSNENDIKAKVSNDSESIIFVSQTTDDCRVVRLKKYQDNFISENLFNCIDNESLDIDMNSEGTQLFYTYQDKQNPVSRIFSMVINTGQKKQLTNYLASHAMGDNDLVFSAKHNKIYFLRRSSARKTTILEYDFEADQEREISEHDTWLNEINIREPNNSLIYKEGENSIVEQYIDSKVKKEIVSSLNDRIYRYDFNQIKNSVLIVTGKQENKIWKSDISYDSNEIQEEPEVLIASDYQDYLPRYANTSDTFAFISDRSGQQQVWIKESNEAERQLTNFTEKGLISWFRWSPSDDYILSVNKDSVFTVNVKTGELITIIKGSEYSEPAMPTWSHDGKEIYFSSKQDGDIQLYKKTLSTGEIERQTETGNIALFDQGGNGQFFLKAHKRGLWKIADVREQLVISDVGSSKYFHALEFSDLGVYFIKDTSGQIYFKSFKNTDKNQLVMKTSNTVPHRLFSVSPSGSQLIYYSVEKQNTNILESY